MVAYSQSARDDDPVGTRTHGSGAIHLAFASVAFLAVLVGTILASSVLRGQTRWQLVAIPMLILSWGAIVPLLALGRASFHPHSLGGLYEKVYLGMELLWLAVVALPIAYRNGDAT